MKNFLFLPVLCLIIFNNQLYSQNTLRDYGVKIGVMKTGKNNAITDVPGVKVGHKTLISGEDIRTGVTAIVPHEGNLFRKKVPAAIFVGNGFGKLAGYTQVKELGNIETPVILTNTMSVAAALDALITYTLAQEGNGTIGSVNGIVGETNDGGLNDIRARVVKPADVLEAIANAKSGIVEQGGVGAGTGTICFGFKGGIGTSSRVLPKSLGGYTVGVLVQTNYGGVLEVAGAPVGQMLNNYSYRNNIMQDADGSCMIVVITDAPLTSRNLERVAKRAFMGLAKSGGIASNGSGDYIIAMSVAKENLLDESSEFYLPKELQNDAVSPVFMATIEATEEALINSLVAAKTMKGYKGKVVEELPKEIIKRIAAGMNLGNHSVQIVP
ncbi:MAG: P1 family peptidase [Bacteroidales bacterium]|jgi:D-aminopeptidase|nr:P1 family peptidase [Bacteroidales bacterium]